MKKLCTIILLAFTGINVNAQYSALLDFTNTNPNGSNPYGDLLSDGTFLYGMTWGGGTSGVGTIFKIKPDGTGYLKLLDFTGSANGSNPIGSLISDGTFLYGMAGGGANNKGVIFKIKPDGTGYLKLLDFAGATNGDDPWGSLISDGTFLYGMTFIGGTNNYGTIFKIKTDGTGYLKLLDFAIANGSYPLGSLITDGTFLYGMTNSGGTSNLGTIFKIKPDGTGYTKLYDFPNASNGPYGSLIYDGIFLYGMARGGGANNMGMIFKIKPDGTGYINLLDFAGLANGSDPRGSLISDGTFLYGLTAGGGASNRGTIFKIKPDGTGYVDLLDFSSVPNGRNPFGSLVSVGGCLYGMTSDGGLYSYSQGTVFKYCIAAGIAENNIIATDFTIYPNPSNGQFQIQVNNKALAVSNEYKLEIYNVVGELVYSTSTFKRQISNGIDLSSQPNGIYFYSVSDKNNVHQSGKLVLNK